MDDAPYPPAALHGQRGFEDRRMLVAFQEPHAAAPVTPPHVIECAAHGHVPVVNHRDVVRHPLHFIEQMRGEDHRTPVIGHGSNDGIEDVAAHDCVKTGRRLVQNQ
jgi:hypothetical protein